MERINRFFDSGSFSYDIILGCGTFYFLANGNMAPLNTLLIDADGIVYRCGFATEKVKYLVQDAHGDYVEIASNKEAKAFLEDTGEGFLWSRKELKPEEECLSLVKTVLDKIKAKFPDYENQRIILSNDGPTFRHRLATISNYKGTRTKDKPTHYASIRKYLNSAGAELAGAGLEADDTVSMLSANSGLGNRRSVVVSLDKDLDQIPGLHYNWVKEETYEIDKRQACLNLYSQILSGDPTDNIRGIEGIGPVKAHQMLKDCTGVRDCWETVLRAYTSKYGELGKDYAIETARLCYLLRKEGEQWNPPNE